VSRRAVHVEGNHVVGKGVQCETMECILALTRDGVQAIARIAATRHRQKRNNRSAIWRSTAGRSRMAVRDARATLASGNAKLRISVSATENLS
jgi:hypothetical protein